MITGQLIRNMKAGDYFSLRRVSKSALDKLARSPAHMRAPSGDETKAMRIGKALHALAGDIQSEDGVANAVVAEAAQRIEELAEIQQFLEWKIAALTDGTDVKAVTLDEWRDLRRN